ncbi:hypothetical protein [Acidisoma silvae]|uniref:Uncharacterized protein n=1 Tax=Acidisoma silvae TaxID=2802396 RepID=A0A964E1J9_9PROT|nr:hypothetical protein [Acidisoma silvae]MCB8878327.1 hypothetical protein [Acidisoma silvae]
MDGSFEGLPALARSAPETLRNTVFSFECGLLLPCDGRKLVAPMFLPISGRQYFRVAAHI